MSFKALRRSKDAKASSSPAPISAQPILSKPASAKTFTPQKVIRSLDARRATSPQELSFSKGDFFYVIKEVDLPTGLWYEALNTVSGSRGLVPRASFEEFNKGSATLGSPRTSTLAAAGIRLPNSPALSTPPLPQTPRHQTFYAIVQYDFVAERPDELDSKAGEPISVIAQSNREWYVAKPIGRLGGPGLIPASFVEIRDPSSGRKMEDSEMADIMDRGILPKVEEWKKATSDYKASSIPLGVIDIEPPVPHSPYASTNSRFETGSYSRPVSSTRSEPQNAPDITEILPPGLWIAASIPSFHREEGEYWFRLNIEYQPDPEPHASALPPLIAGVLYRNYDDFYAFQLELLDSWPVEAGRQKRHPDAPELTETDRILPYMPGPVDTVDDGVTADRQRDLDIYVKELVDLASSELQAEHVLRCDLVRRFLAQKPGDVILPPEHAEDRTMTRSRGSERNDEHAPFNSPPFNDDPYHGSARMDGPGASRESAYSERDAWPDGGMRQPNGHSPYGVPGYSIHETTNQRASSSSYAQSQSQPSPTRSSHYQVSPTSQGNRVRSPTVSSTAPTSVDSPTFLKIKIFHSSTDDLIAIRVSPRVTYAQLLAKVKDRLGQDVHALKYRDGASSGNKSSITIVGEQGLKDWVATNSKLVLYAE